MGNEGFKYEAQRQGRDNIPLRDVISFNYLFLFVFLSFFAILLFSCDFRTTHDPHSESRLFKLLDHKKTGIDFVNELDYSGKLNPYSYHNLFNGAGVGLGDINNDGLLDIYFCGNLEDNRLYLNKGKMKFRDITEKAGVACRNEWSAGVSMVDINGDGWLDIYVCQSGILSPQKNRYSELFTKYNKLFINNGDLTFTEKAEEYGLSSVGLSTHAAFFDYDKDGDLDVYLLNNALRSSSGIGQGGERRKIRDKDGGNKLLRNDQGHFKDISEEMGIYGSSIGFGLGVSISDINRDSWPDIYVSNDFFEKDYLYINKEGKSFEEQMEDYCREISLGAMGSDIADINNDGYPEIFTTEMTPEPEERYKTKALFESWDQYQTKIEQGFYHQFARNVLQLNNRNGSFSEIGRLAGVSMTDWSWGALIFDMDNDGWKDIFVANGIFKDLLDQDYLNIYSDPNAFRDMALSRQGAVNAMIDAMPSVRIPNYAFKNNRDMTFTNVSEHWGLDQPSFSNGAAYGDLDNDGDLDIVINNLNMPPFIYQNLTSEVIQKSYLTLVLKGDKMNSNAIGTRVTVFCDEDHYYQELVPMRGFESSSDNRLVFGLGEHKRIDSLGIEWPDGRFTKIHNLEINQRIVVDIKEETEPRHVLDVDEEIPFFKVVTDPDILDFRHRERDFNDFKFSPLLFQMVSSGGPKMVVVDINRDGREDVVLGGNMGCPAEIFLQLPGRKFEKKVSKYFDLDSSSVITDIILFDADQDGDRDLYLSSGGYEFNSGDDRLEDMIYFNNGQGNFSRAEKINGDTYKENTACVRSSDFDGDGDLDLAVGIRAKPMAYGKPANGYILLNDGNGQFTDVTKDIAPGLSNIGMITDMLWADIDGDHDEDLVVIGEYMPVSVFINRQGKLEDGTEKAALRNTSGWWNVIQKADLDMDGDIDFIVGNHGLNSVFKASPEAPITLFINDFDNNGTIEQILCRYNGTKSFPLILRHDLVSQIPYLNDRYPDYNSYKDQTIEDIFSPGQLSGSVKREVVNLASSVLINHGDGTFRVNPLPPEAQYTPIYAIHIMDINDDGKWDVLLGGNQYRSKPEVGIYDGSYGITLLGDGDGNFRSVDYSKSGFFVKGQIRDIKEIRIEGKVYVFAAVNNGGLKIFEKNEKIQKR